MNRRRRAVGLTSILGVLAVACGSRVQPLATNPITGQAAQGTQGPVTSGGTAGQAGQAGTAGKTVDGIGPGLLPGCKPGPSNPSEGILDKEIKVGLVAAIQGAFPGQFNAEVEAVDAHIKGVNAAGGVCGRTFRLIIKDDRGDPSLDLQMAKELAEEEKVFAFVGSISAPDSDTGVSKMSEKHKIPDFGFPLTWDRTESKYTYGVPGQIQRKIIGEGSSGARYLNKLKGVKQVAVYWLRESEVSVLSAWGFEAAIKKATNNKIKICHEQPTGVIDNNFQNYVISMQGNCPVEDGPIGVYSTMENNSNIKLADAMENQDFEPAVFAPTFTSYLPSFARKDDGSPRSSTQGTYIAMPQIPFERCRILNDGRPAPPCSHPELNNYVSTLQKFSPNYRVPGSFGAPGWGTAALFIETVKACGSKLSRACVIDELETRGPFSDNGFLVPTTPGDHLIYSTDLVVQVRNGQFVEIRPDDKSGPKEAPDFWDKSELFNWQKYLCDNRESWEDDLGGDNVEAKLGHPQFDEC